MLKYCLDIYKTQEVCEKAVDACRPLLKFVPGWFITKKMLKNLDNVVSFNDNIVFVLGDSDVKLLVLIQILLMQILIMLGMMINLTKMILKLLFMLVLWLDVIDIRNARHAKKRQSKN